MVGLSAKALNNSSPNSLYIVSDWNNKKNSTKRYKKSLIIMKRRLKKLDPIK